MPGKKSKSKKGKEKKNKKAYMSPSPIGVFAVDGRKELLDCVLFSKEPKKLADNISLLEKGKTLPEEKKLTKKLKKKYQVLSHRKIEGTKKITPEKNPALKAVKNDLETLARKSGFTENREELNSLLSRAGVISTREKLKEQSREKIITQVIGLVDRLKENLNTYSEKLREWYGLYFPEATKIIKSNEELAKLAEIGDKEKLKEKAGKEISKENFKKLRGKLDQSTGMNFTEEDLEALSGFASSLLHLFESERETESYLEKLSEEEAPNLSALAGPLLAARLLELAGGLKKMARMPSSRIQLLGAEKALFRHLRDEGKSPKYGVIFAHPHIQNAPDELKGKVARLLAAKLSMAAKIDYFSREDRSKKLKKELEEDIKEALGK